MCEFVLKTLLFEYVFSFGVFTRKLLIESWSLDAFIYLSIYWLVSVTCLVLGCVLTYKIKK